MFEGCGAPESDTQQEEAGGRSTNTRPTWRSRLASAANLDRFTFPNVGKERQFSRAVDLQRQLSLVLGAEVRCTLRQDLTQAVHVLLQLFWPLVVEG